VTVVAVVNSADDDENAPKLKKGFAEGKYWSVHQGNYYTLRGGTVETHDDQHLQSLSMLGGAKSLSGGT